jgi:molybdate transport system substrate-binding protein
MTRRQVLAAGLFLGLAAASCVARAGERVTVFAAASLRNALDEAAAAFHGARVTMSYAGSSSLARQIERGAPASVFISADLAWMDYLDARGRLEPGSRRALLGNRLVLIAPAAAGPSAHIERGMPLARRLGARGRLAIGNPDHVPAGMYAKAALESLGVWNEVENRLAPTENVRLALALVARGEAPLGIVYATDAAAEPNVRVIERLEPSLHPPIVYPMALIEGSGAQARAFADYLRQPQARRIFEKHGFIPLD